MEKIVEIFEYLWGTPLTIIVVAAGLYFSYCVGFIQFVGIKKIWRNTFGKLFNKKVSKKEKENSYRTITSVLGGTIGAGNVAGVATAIAAGGPGAVFWMWLIALFGMATKMVEVMLAVKHQEKDSKGNNIGGPMYYIRTIKGKFGKILAGIYSVALLTYLLCDSGFVQINTIASSLTDTFSIPLWIIGGVIIVLSLLVVSGGLKRIGNILEKMVPGMYGFYIIAALIVIFANVGNIPSSFAKIFEYAFKPAPIIGGFAGATVAQAIAKGSARGIFANEAGLGTSTTVHATTKNDPVTQGLWGMIEVTVVSFMVCTITALLVMSTGAWNLGLDGAPMVIAAFETIFGKIGKYILCIVIVLFCYSTYIGFFFEYATCIRYFFNEKVLKYAKWFYVIPAVVAVFLPIDMIWTFADMSVGFAMIPNIIALVILSKEIREIYKSGKKKLI